MKKDVILAFAAAFLLGGCAVGFLGGSDGNSMIIVPMLPVTVEIDADQPYYQNGYYYEYQGNIWLYSDARKGPWRQLPRSHYPKEVRYKGQGKQNEHRDDNDTKRLDR